MDHFYRRTGMYLFIIGLLITIFSSIFQTDPRTTPIIYTVLIFSGVMSAILNITYDEEHHFLVAGSGILIVAIIFQSIFIREQLFAPLISFLKNTSLFVASMLFATGVKVVIEFGAQSDFDELERTDFRAEHLDKIVQTPKEKAWNITVFLAIAVSFILLLLEFFNIGRSLTALITVLDFIVFIIFAIDLVILYKKEKGAGSFVKNCWPDILAAVPPITVLGFLQTFKLLRLARLVRVARITQTTKFFSKESGAAYYIDKANFNEDYSRIDEKSTGIKLHAKRPVKKRPKKK